MTAYRTVISSKGQVVIPAELRQQFGLEKGTPATWSEEKGRLILTPITARRLDEIMGFLKPKPGEPSMFEESLAERERERKRERTREKP
jgi:AbrB family looped-hinge helix DNA binding protein